MLVTSLKVGKLVFLYVRIFSLSSFMLSDGGFSQQNSTRIVTRSSWVPSGGARATNVQSCFVGVHGAIADHHGVGVEP